MVRSEFGVEPDRWQLDALEAFSSGDPDKQRISLQACAGPGKSALLSWLGWNFMVCYNSTGQHPKGAAVSITWDNLQDNLWPEFAKWQHRSKFLMECFVWTKTRIFAKDHPETWFLSARSWPKTANADEQGRTLSGMHSEYVLFLIDESGEIPLTVLKAAEQALSNCWWGKIVQSGNPTTHNGMLYAAATELAHQWHVIAITGDPDDEGRSPRIDIRWAREQIALYGRDNPWVMGYILGLFPPGGINALLGPDEVREAMRRHLILSEYDFSQKRLGVDVALEGDDRTVIFPRQGKAAFRPTVMRNATPSQIAARVQMAKVKWGSDMEFVDNTGGWGSGVVDQLNMTATPAIPINFSGKAIDPRYFNIRSEMYFMMADWVKSGGALPNMPSLVKELTAPTYTFQKGMFRLEEKAMIKKRIGVSPDLADALALTFALPDMPGPQTDIGGVDYGGKLKTDYDPYSNERL